MLKQINVSKYSTRASFCLLLIPVLLLLAACSIIPDTGTSTSTQVTPTAAVSTPTGTSISATPTATSKPKKGTSAITITDNGFTPATLTVKVGTVVIWTNTGVVDHNVTSTNGPTLKSPLHITSGKTFSFKFTKAGTYNYNCTFHASFMIGKIIVK